MAEGQLHTCDNLSGQALSSISEQERVKAPQHSGIMTGCIFARASRREGAEGILRTRACAAKQKQPGDYYCFRRIGRA